MSKVAAVILNYNTAKDTINCVNLLMQQSKELTMIVVDNNSQDDSVQEIKKVLGDKIILIENKNNAGYSAGNNLGLKKAIEDGCKYALIINPDVEINDLDAIKKAVEELEKDSKIAMLGPDVIDINGVHQNPQRELKFFEDTFWPIALLLFKLKKENRYVVDYKTNGYCEKVVGCCMFANLAIMKEIGFFDENVFLYSEEPIISARIHNAGYKIYYTKDIQVKHNHVESEKANKKERMMLIMDSRSYYLSNYKYQGFKKKVALKAIKSEKKYYSRKKEK